jgi:AraC-like DNA-binding protein
MERAKLSEAKYEQTIAKYGIDLELYKMTPGTFQADPRTREVNGNVLYCGYENQSFLGQYSVPQNSFGIVSACSPNGAVTANGQQLDGDSLYVVPPLQGVDMAIPLGTSARSLLISEQRFSALAESVSPRLQPSNLAGLVRGNAEHRDWLRRQTQRLVQAPFTDPDHVDFDNLIAEWVAWLGQPGAEIEGRHARARERQARIARQARTYFVDNYAQPIRMEDACRELGVGLRTLQRCFANYFQMTPCGYLKILRYNKARLALIEHDPGTNSVTSIAMDNGFYHFGRFAVEYRDLFGELPRDSLASNTLAIAA